MSMIGSLAALNAANAANAGLAAGAANTANGANNTLGNKEPTRVIGDKLSDPLAEKKEEVKPEPRKPIKVDDDTLVELAEMGISTNDLHRLTKGFQLPKEELFRLSPALRNKLGDDIELLYSDDEIVNSNLPQYFTEQSMAGGPMPPDWNDDDDDENNDENKRKKLKEKWRKYFKDYANESPDNKSKLVKATKDLFKQRNENALDDLMKEINEVAGGDKSNLTAFNKLMENQSTSKVSTVLRKVLGVKGTDKLLNGQYTQEQISKITQIVEKMKPYLDELEEWGLFTGPKE